MTRIEKYIQQLQKEDSYNSARDITSFDIATKLWMRKSWNKMRAILLPAFCSYLLLYKAHSYVICNAQLIEESVGTRKHTVYSNCRVQGWLARPVLTLRCTQTKPNLMTLHTELIVQEAILKHATTRSRESRIRHYMRHFH